MIGREPAREAVAGAAATPLARPAEAVKTVSPAAERTIRRLGVFVSS